MITLYQDHWSCRSPLPSSPPCISWVLHVLHSSSLGPSAPTADTRYLLISALFLRLLQVPIPPYLLALAVGRLDSVNLGPRTRVWSEPEMVEAAAYEFSETAKFLEAGM